MKVWASLRGSGTNAWNVMVSGLGLIDGILKVMVDGEGWDRADLVRVGE